MNEKDDVKEILEFVRYGFSHHLANLHERQKKVKEGKFVHPEAFNESFGQLCGFCNVGRLIAEKHEDLSFPEAELTKPEDEETCPLRQMKRSIMDEMLENSEETVEKVERKIEKEKKLYT